MTRTPLPLLHCSVGVPRMLVQRAERHNPLCKARIPTRIQQHGSKPPARTSRALQRLITGRTTNAERRPVRVSVSQLLQPLEQEQNHFPTLRCCIVGAPGGSTHEALCGVGGGLKNKYVFTFMYISNRNLTPPTRCASTVQGADIPAVHEVPRSEMYKLIRKSQQTEPTKSDNTGLRPGIHKGVAQVRLQRKPFISETGEVRRDVVKVGLSCFTAGGWGLREADEGKS